jgi:pyruvate/2-oxoglutarate/acetoin dehydrogenase E1 component
MEKDPILRTREALVKRGWLSEDEDMRIKEKVEREIRDAIEFALSAPYPDPREALFDVFANPPTEATGVPDIGLPKGERPLPMYKAIQEAIAQEMERDSSVFVMGEDIGVYGGIWSETAGLIDRFGPERVRDTPISESAFVGAAVGASALGMRPIVDLMFADFIGATWDQIFNHLAKDHHMSGGQVKHPVVLMMAVGGGYRDAAQHSQVLTATFAHVPGLKVVFPSNSYDAKGLMIQAIRDDDPVVYLFHKGTMGLPWMPYPETAITHVPEEPYTIPFGKARVVREGENVTVIATGLMVHRVLEAAEILAKEGISVELIDPRTVVPLDKKTIINSVKKTGRLLVVDEDYLSYGLTSEIIAVVSENALEYLKAPPRRLAVPDTPIPFSPVLERFVIPSVERIVDEVRSLVKKP